MRALRLVAVGLFALLTVSGCHRRQIGRPNIPEQSLPASMRSQGEGPARCQQAASENAPLLTELPATDKANLEILTRSGAVAVSFSGCSMQVLYNCRLGGQYIWYAVSPTSDSFEINDEDSLFAKLPLGALSLGADLQRWGKLNVQTSVSGQLRLDGLRPEDIPFQGECSRATHVIGALSVGAFVMSTSGGGSVGGGLEAFFAGGGGKVASGASVVRSAGQPDTCNQPSEQAPPQSCRSPIQAFLWAIPRGPAVARRNELPHPVMPVPAPPAVAMAPAPAPVTAPVVASAPAPVPAMPPIVAAPAPVAAAPAVAVPATPRVSDSPVAASPLPVEALKNVVQVEMLSAHANSRWDVYVNDEVVCTTPCTRLLNPSHPIFLRAREHDFMMPPDELSVPHLFPAANQGNVQLQARPTVKGELAAGATFASLGGTAIMTGIALAGVGCSGATSSSMDGGMCGGGMITLGAGTLVTAGAIWLILDSLPKAVVAPVRQYVAAYSN